MLHAGHARASLNALWLWVSFGLAFLTVRQLIRSGSQQRAVCSMLIALSVGMAAYGMYQVAYSNPRQREEYAKDPDAFLRRQNAYSPPGSPERRHFENRLTSTEPIGPFALTNSLAGFLTPCFLLLVACTAQLWLAAALPVWHRGEPQLRDPTSSRNKASRIRPGSWSRKKFQSVRYWSMGLEVTAFRRAGRRIHVLSAQKRVRIFLAYASRWCGLL